MFNILPQSTFGLDLSDLSIKIAWLKKHKNGLELISYGRTEIAPGIIEKGVIQNKEALIQALQNAAKQIKGQPLKTKKCVVSLPEAEAFIRVVQLPLMEKTEINEAIQWEAEANIPLPLEKVYLDWQIIKPHEPQPNHHDILIGALAKDLVDSYLEVLKKAGLKPVAFEIESIATTRALIKNGFSEEPILIIDLGAQRTSLIIFNDSTLYFTTSLPIANNELTTAIAKALRVDKTRAQELKFKIGLDKSKEQGKVFQALEPLLKNLTQKINEYLAYYQAHALPGHAAQKNQITKIILCGGGANLIGLAPFLSQELNLKIEIGNPWINILKPDFKKIPELPFKESISYTTALGLAWRGANL